MYIYIYVCVYIYMYMYMYMISYIYVYIYMCVCMYVCTCNDGILLRQLSQAISGRTAEEEDAMDSQAGAAGRWMSPWYGGTKCLEKWREKW